MPGPEHPPLHIYVPYVPEHVYPEFMPPEDDVLPAEEQPLPDAISPTVDSSGYITESDPEEDPEEEDDKDPKEDPADYPTDRDDDDKEEEESFGDDADDEEEDEGEDEEEEEEHLAPADSIPPPAYRTTARMVYPKHSYRAAMIQLRAELPSTLHPLPLPPPIVLPCTRASMAMMRVVAPSTYCLAPLSGTPPLRTPPILPIPLPTSSPPLFEIKESSSALATRSTGGFRADYGFVATLDAEIRRYLDREIGYGITYIWEDLNEIAKEIPATDVAELGQWMTDFVMTVRQDTDEIYVRLDDAQDDRLASRKAWVQSMDASDMAHSETQMVALQSQQRPPRDPAHPDVLEEAISSS
ncbi:hypothetical protein Tco_0151477 [Tanacetum coccineum]